MIELQTSVRTSKQDDTTCTRTPKPGYLKLTNTMILGISLDKEFVDENFKCKLYTLIRP
jgi:hypothetical protein